MANKSTEREMAKTFQIADFDAQKLSEQHLMRNDIRLLGVALYMVLQVHFLSDKNIQVFLCLLLHQI